MVDLQTPAVTPADRSSQTSGVQPPTARQSTLYKVFLGPQGLRAGWKIPILVVLMLVLLIVLVTPFAWIIGKPAPHSAPPMLLTLANEVASAVAALLATALLAKFLDKRPWGYFGLPLARAFRSEFWIGALIGFGALAIQLELMHLGGWFDFGQIALHDGAILRYGAFWTLFFLGAGFFEEGMLRGYSQRVLTNGMGFWPAAVVLSIPFACLHLGNSGENLLGILEVFANGMLMCFSLWRTGNIWFAVGNHAAWDWAQTFFFGTPDSGMKPIGALFAPSFHGPALLSGGADGPEASVLVLLSEALTAALILILYRNRKYPLMKDQEPSPGPVITKNAGKETSDVYSAHTYVG